MSDHPPVRRCGRCNDFASYRLALVDVDEKPGVILTRRAHYRCDDCFLLGFTTDALAGLKPGQTVVVDPAFTAEVHTGRCLCGLPAGHRKPDAGEPRACIDETVRMVRVPAFVTRDGSGFRPGVPLTDAQAELLGPEPTDYRS